MKLSVAFLMCSVLMYATVSHVTADKDDDDYDACMAQYLKNKGKLPNDYRIGEVMSVCETAVEAHIEFLSKFVNDEVKKEFPNEVVCVMEQYKKNEIVDLFLQITLMRDEFKRSDNTLSELEMGAKGKIVLDELQKQLVATGDACGLAEEKFLPVFNPVFYAKPITVAATSLD